MAPPATVLDHQNFVSATHCGGVETVKKRILLRGTCELCDHERDLLQDHNHENGLCRGRLCSSCNHLIAQFDRSAEFIRRMLAYIEKWQHVHGSVGGVKYR